MDLQRKEIESFIKNEKGKVVSKEEVPKYANVITGRFVIAIKVEHTAQEIFKARYVVKGHEHIMKNNWYTIVSFP